MSFKITIQLPAQIPGEGPLVEKRDMQKFYESLPRGNLIYFGHVFFKVNRKIVPLREVLGLTYEEFSEAHFAVVKALINDGKILLTHLGALVNLVNVANGTWNARFASAVSIDLGLVQSLKDLNQRKWAINQSILLVGDKPTVQRGESRWDPKALDIIYKEITSEYVFYCDVRKITMDVALMGKFVVYEMQYEGDFFRSYKAPLDGRNSAWATLAISLAAYSKYLESIGALEPASGNQLVKLEPSGDTRSPGKTKTSKEEA